MRQESALQGVSPLLQALTTKKASAPHGTHAYNVAGVFLCLETSRKNTIE